jgi:hypothetical protein
VAVGQGGRTAGVQQICPTSDGQVPPKVFDAEKRRRLRHGVGRQQVVRRNVFERHRRLSRVDPRKQVVAQTTDL